MNKYLDPKDLIISKLLKRSECAVQVASAIEDEYGIFSWGWNSMGSSGLGIHAEDHAIERANPRRLFGSTIYVAARRKRNNKIVTAKPCLDCDNLIKLFNIGRVVYRDGEGRWIQSI